MNAREQGFRTDLAFARELDAVDPLAPLRDEFIVPTGPDGSPLRYFCGNSLGLMPRRAVEYVQAEMETWAREAVDGHHRKDAPWYTYHEQFRGPLARLAGAKEHEIVLMNSLTVNLHLLMVSFFRPEPVRRKILIEAPCFPSDLYAVKTHLGHHGLDPREALVQVGPRPGEATLREEDIEAAIAREGAKLALVLLGGVNFLTGQRLDLARIARAAKQAGARVGFDLAHGMGNVPLALHDSGADFAVWCSYKYLNAGPGAVAGAYVHESNVRDLSLPRFGGWWGNDPRTRFRMQLEPDFVPVPSADGWQVSNPPILAMAPLRASLELFDRAGMPALRAKSVRLTSYLHDLLVLEAGHHVAVITPEDPERRGCQLSLRLREGALSAQKSLAGRGFTVDFREPDILRVAPTPFYNTFHDAWLLARALSGR